MTINKENFIKKQWVTTGIAWGIIMFFLSVIGLPFFQNDPITLKNVLIGFPLWILGGLGYGFIIKGYLERENLKKDNE